MKCIQFISGAKVDDRIIRCELDAGFKEGRQYGRGQSGGQVCFFCIAFLEFINKRFEMIVGRIMILIRVVVDMGMISSCRIRDLFVGIMEVQR